MVDLDFHIQVIMSEILTLDSEGSIRSKDLSQVIDLNVLQQLSVGQIYRDDGVRGSGFIIGISDSGPLLLTCKHTAIDMFTNKLYDSFVNFEINQQGCSTDLINRHSCGQFFKLQLLELASDLFDAKSQEIDPITGFDYNFEFDAALFIVKSECMCGRLCELPDLTPAKFYSQSLSNEMVYVLGFMGNITELTSPLTSLTESELNLMKTALPEGILTESKGNIINQGDLICITNPTTNGFSGSPVFVKISGGVYVWGIFLGGPALPDHKYLVNLSNLLALDKSEALKAIEQIDTNEIRCIKDYTNILRNRLMSLDLNTGVANIKSLYSRMISYSRKSQCYDERLLNHNLCLPLSRIKNFINRFGSLLIE